MRNYILLTSIALILVLSGCSANVTSETGPYPATDIISNEPVVIGYIVEVLEEEQIIFVKTDITKEEAMKSDKNDTGYKHSFFSNSTTFDGELKKGYKVAVWKFEEEEEGNVGVISERIVILEK